MLNEIVRYSLLLSSLISHNEWPFKYFCHFHLLLFIYFYIWQKESKTFDAFPLPAVLWLTFFKFYENILYFGFCRIEHLGNQSVHNFLEREFFSLFAHTIWWMKGKPWLQNESLCMPIKSWFKLVIISNNTSFHKNYPLIGQIE